MHFKNGLTRIVQISKLEWRSRSAAIVQKRFVNTHVKNINLNSSYVYETTSAQIFDGLKQSVSAFKCCEMNKVLKERVYYSD